MNEGRVDRGFCELQKEPPINPYLDGVLVTSYRVHTHAYYPVEFKFAALFFNPVTMLHYSRLFAIVSGAE